MECGLFREQTSASSANPSTLLQYNNFQYTETANEPFNTFKCWFWLCWRLLSKQTTITAWIGFSTKGSLNDSRKPQKCHHHLGFILRQEKPCAIADRIIAINWLQNFYEGVDLAIALCVISILTQHYFLVENLFPNLTNPIPLSVFSTVVAYRFAPFTFPSISITN